MVLTCPVYQGLDQLAAIQAAIQVDIVHPEIVKHQLLLGHGGDVYGNVHMLLHVPNQKNCKMDNRTKSFYF